jgi:AraC family transcriptional regulator, regulatory protein of adaptative response / methylated-DNA-[protein]-cysteine methyltransferase
MLRECKIHWQFYFGRLAAIRQSGWKTGGQSAESGTPYVMNDYGRIEQVIRYLDAHHGEQPRLDKLAALVGLSETHFHRLFRRWAGITPKDFLQCLTAEFARKRLRESRSVLEAALACGLSGPGRLHDLLVMLEAASPGEIRLQGAGTKLDWGFAETPFGRCSLAWNARGICHWAFSPDDAADSEPPELIAYWTAAERRRNDPTAQQKIHEIFSLPRDGTAGLRAFVRGTPFQVQVWRALLRIPEGCVASYGWIARFVGNPTATRAVGTACGQNPIAFLIPCHRVIRETGIVQGYHWGTPRKQAMLTWEAARNNVGSKARPSAAIDAGADLQPDSRRTE